MNNGKKIQKKRDARPELLFCLINLLLFAVLVAVAVVVAKAAEYDARKGLNFLRLNGRGSVSKENMNFLVMYFFWPVLGLLTIIPRARMGSESIAHEAEARMGY